MYLKQHTNKPKSALSLVVTAYRFQHKLDQIHQGDQTSLLVFVSKIHIFIHKILDNFLNFHII